MEGAWPSAQQNLICLIAARAEPREFNLSIKIIQGLIWFIHAFAEPNLCVSRRHHLGVVFLVYLVVFSINPLACQVASQSLSCTKTAFMSLT